MSSIRYTEKAEEVVSDTKEALQLLWDNINKGQRKQIIKVEAVKILFDRCGVSYESDE